MLRLPSSLATLALSLAAACGGGSSTIAQADVAHQFATVQCAKILSCCSGTPGGPTQASCEAKITQLVQASINASLSNTHVKYDGAAAGSCLGELNASTCEDLVTSQHTPSCDRVTIGNVALGGQCSNQDDCQSRLCAGLNYDGNGNITTPGTCKAPTAVGASCNLPQGTTLGQVCVQGSYVTGSADACVCAAAQANGAACTGYERCASAYCDGASHVCAAYPVRSSLNASECQNFYANL